MTYTVKNILTNKVIQAETYCELIGAVKAANVLNDWCVIRCGGHKEKT